MTRIRNRLIAPPSLAVTVCPDSRRTTKFPPPRPSVTVPSRFARSSFATFTPVPHYHGSGRNAVRGSRAGYPGPSSASAIRRSYRFADPGLVPPLFLLRGDPASAEHAAGRGASTPLRPPSASPYSRAEALRLADLPEALRRREDRGV